MGIRSINLKGTSDLSGGSEDNWLVFCNVGLSSVRRCVLYIREPRVVNRCTFAAKVSLTLDTLIASCLRGSREKHIQDNICGAQRFSNDGRCFFFFFFSFRGYRDITTSSSHLKEIKLATLPQCGSVAQAVAFYWKLPFAKLVFTNIN